MIIRSQDKRKITNFSQASDFIVAKNRVEQWEILACYSYFAESDCGYSAIATYSTEEKAIKVLDMIEGRYNNLETAKVETKLKHWTPFIFQMPQDGEVEE